MSLRVGLGASQADIDVQGEIDFDFFDESGNSNASVPKTESAADSLASENNTSTFQDEEIQEETPEEIVVGSPCSQSFSKPVIKVSCDNATGAVQKTTIETVIPTPYNYKESKCGKSSPNVKHGTKKTHSPCLQRNLLKDENMSDDSSISSMSESESEISSVSPDSFELDEESDSMTDVSPLASPYKCSTPAPGDKNQTISDKTQLSKLKKDSVKFKSGEKETCENCESLDFKELVSAMKRLKMKQSTNPLCALRCKSPIVTQNMRTRKNLSFTNEEVRRIDSDNQVLLKKILTHQNRAHSCGSLNVPLRSSSAVNRQKQQRQIDVENMAFLKRLESAKASRSLSRSQLLRDYDKRTSGLLSRASSRSSYPSSSSRMTCRSSSQSSGCSSAQHKSSLSVTARSQSTLSVASKLTP